MPEQMVKLLSYLNQASPGSIDSEKVGDLLAAGWHELDGNKEGGMEAYKLKHRTEVVEWHPPVLKFRIERHGSMVMGSIYATVQSWTVDLANGTASIDGEKKRQVGQKARPLKVVPLVEEICAAIEGHTSDPRLEFRRDGLVKILIQKVIPATNRQTTTSRRKRFWQKLEERVAPLGWDRRSIQSPFIEKNSVP